ncbi:MAG: hypothetical protein ACPG49_12445 [Chitinophagales bacterium]
MNTTFHYTTPNSSKLYSIQCDKSNFRNVHNAILGNARQPYHFRFWEIAEGSYLLVRYKDGLVICCNDEELEMRTTFAPNCILVRPIEVKEGLYALAVRNQGVQKYICCNGFVLNEYFISLEVVNSIEEAAIWKIQEVSKISLPTAEYFQFRSK